MRNRRMAMAGFLVVGMVAATVVSSSPAAAVDVVTRLSGDDRYATAVAISQEFDPGVPVVFLATGENFPDALAAGPAAVRAEGPVLLTARDALPQVVHGELNRLDPVNIVVLGSPTVISDNVLLQAQNYASGTAVRLAGTDRFDTAAQIASNFPAGVELVYIASGRTFPDALAAGPAAAQYDSPLLLVEPGSIPASTAAQLDRLDPELIVIAGGESAVSLEVELQLQVYADAVDREFGDDRFATSAAISSNTFETASVVFLATGLNFPDALAGGALAGSAAAPILLVHQDCIPAPAYAEINRLQPEVVVLLGGESALSPSVAGLSACPGPGLPSTG